MVRRTRAFLAVLAAVSLAAQPAFAVYDDVGVSARITGMGNAYTAVADDVYSAYYNPAGLATLDRPEFAAGYTRLLTGLSDNSSIQNSFFAYAHPLDDGRRGTVAAALNSFTLDSLYRETSFFASYGRVVTREDNPNPLFLGISEKYLSRALGATPAANNSITNTGVVLVGVQDPVLQGANKTNFDTDLGALWRFREKWNFGAQIQHLLQPNVAFSSSDSEPLQRNIRMGGAYHTPFSILSADIDFIAAPDGSVDKIMSLGVEKWLPTLLYGSFALRGGFGSGSRDYHQLTLGASYKIHRMQIDYGYAIPVGGLAGTGGAQRFGLTWRFGGTKQSDALLGEMMLENLASTAKPGTPEFAKQAEALVNYKRKALDLLSRDAQAEARLGHFDAAYQRFRQAASLSPHDAAMVDLDERYRSVAAYFPDVSAGLRDPAGAVLHDALLKFIAGKDRESLAALANARLMRATPAIDGMILVLETKIAAAGGAPVAVAPAPAPAPVAPVAAPAPVAPAVAPTPVAAAPTPAAVPPQVPAPAPAPVPAAVIAAVPALPVAPAAVPAAVPPAAVVAPVPATPPAVPTAAVAPSSAPAADTVADSLKRILDSTSALMEVSFFQQEWDKVVKLAEQVIVLDPSNLNAYKRLAGAQHALKKDAEALKALRAAYALETDEAERGKLKAYIAAIKAAVDKQNRPAPAAKPAARSAGSPADAERLYEAGVEFYAQARLTEAREAFRRCLEIDPNYTPAQRALQRVQSEIIQSGKDR